MAALQLFTHLEALNVALLIPEEEREKWKGLSQGLSEYYNSPGRLGVFRRRFESTIRRSGMDPATFSTDLGILAVRGFGDMGKRARDAMIRDRFIVAQRSCGLRRHLDGVSSDTPIRDIVDRCQCGRVIRNRSRARGLVGIRTLWERMTTLRISEVSGRIHRNSWCVREWRVPTPVVGVIPRNVETQWKVGNGDGQLAPLEAISSLVTRLLQSAQEGGKRPLGKRVGEGVFLVWTPGTWGEPMFAGGHFFPISTTGVVCGCPEWSISGDTDRWNWHVVCYGKRGMVRAGGSASRIIGDQCATDPGGGVGGSRRGQPAWQLPVGCKLGTGWASDTQVFPPLGSHPTEACGQDNRKLSGRTKMVLGSGNPIVPISPVGMDGGSSSVVPQVSGARKHGRGMWPAGGNRRFPQRAKDELTGEGENTRKVPLSVEAEEFSLRTVPKIRITTEEGSDGSGEYIPSRERHGGIVKQSNAVVSTTAWG